jgi:glycosyltransferase involved in cell wall biosynthesis
MRILRIIARLNVGGPARHVVWLTDALRDEEFHSTLIAGSVPPGEDDMTYFADEHDVHPVIIREMSREISPSDIRSLVRIYRAMRRERPDVIHTHTAKAGTLGRVAGLAYKWLTPGSFIGRPRRVRFVHTFHGHVFHSYYSPAKTRVFLAIEKVLARVATDKIIVLSDQQLAEISSKFRVGRRQQFTIVPLGVDVDSLESTEKTRSEVRSELGLDEDAIAVGFVGRLTEIKNIPLLLEAAALTQASRDRVRFFIAGDGHLRGELEQRATELKLENIAFLGNRTDVAALYAAFDIVALTSLNEGTPLSLIEAMAAGKPVISTGVGGVRDLLGEAVDERDGFSICERGVRVETFEAADLDRGLQYLVDDADSRKRLAESGREFARVKYGKERLIADIKRLYRELVSD